MTYQSMNHRPNKNIRQFLPTETIQLNPESITNSFYQSKNKIGSSNSEPQYIQTYSEIINEEDLDSLEKLMLHERILHRYINYLKGIFILTEIIEVIEQDNLLNLEEDDHLEFMLLVSKRALKYVEDFWSAIVSIKKQNEAFYEKINEEMDISQVEAYSVTISSKFKAYNKNIDISQKTIRKRIRSVSDFIYQSPNRKNRYKYLDGYEGLDYSEIQQIQFTYDRYIEKILNSAQIVSEYFKNHRFKKVLKSYREICLIEGPKNKKIPEVQSDIWRVVSRRQLQKRIEWIILQK